MSKRRQTSAAAATPTEFSLTAAGVRFLRNAFGKPSLRIKGVLAATLRAEVDVEVARRVELFCSAISADQHVPGDTRGWSKWRIATPAPDRIQEQYGECCHCSEQLCYVVLSKGSEKAVHATHRSGPCFLCEAALGKAVVRACVVSEVDQKAGLREAFRKAELLGPAIPQWVKAPWE